MNLDQVREFLDTQYQGQDYIHLLLHVGKDEHDEVFISDMDRTGNHYTYLHFDLRLFTFIYSDSCDGWKIPENLETVLLPLLKEIAWRHSKRCLPANLKYLVYHVQAEGKSSFLVRQTCGVMCGIAALLPAIAALDTTLWQALTGIVWDKHSHLVCYKADLFNDVTSYSTILRINVIKWLVRGMVDIKDLQRYWYMIDLYWGCQVPIDTYFDMS